MKKAAYFILPIIIIVFLIPVFVATYKLKTEKDADPANRYQQAENAPDQSGGENDILNGECVQHSGSNPDTDKDDTDLCGIDLDRSGFCLSR